MVELDTPKVKNHPKEDNKKSSSAHEMKANPEISNNKPSSPPVPARRNISQSPISPQAPTPATRRINTLDKIEKNNENEIIQLQSINSENESYSSESKKNSKSSSKHNTVISINEKKKKEPTSSIRVFHEAEKMPDDINETFFVIKHGKWAEETSNDAKETEVVATNDVKHDEELESIKNLSQNADESPALKKKPKSRHEKKKNNLSKKRDSITTSMTTSFTSSSSESVTDEIIQPQKKSKNHKSKNISQIKSKKVSEDQTPTSNTEESKKETTKMEITSSDKAVAIYIKSTSPMKYRREIKGLRIKISFYNVDNGKQIGDLMWTKNATYNNDFNNFICQWNEKVKANFDLKRLREIYNNVLIFFEVINNENIPVCWAFMKLFTQTNANIDKKLKLQFFEYQVTRHSCFPIKFRKEKILSNDISIYEQWQMPRKKLSSVLNVYLKDINLNSNENDDGSKEDVKVNRIQVLCANEQQYWRKIPGQTCKVPNQIFKKIPLQDKGSLNIQFSHDGNYLAFSEVSINGHILHIYKFPEMTEIFMMLEHSDIIHDMDWKKQRSNNQQYLVTASADFTAIVWKLLEDSYTYSILPHPAFVYASKFLKSDDPDMISVVTACRDNIIRIWRNRQGMETFELCQEVKHPKTSPYTFITSVKTRSADAFYSSSSMGDIIEWTLNEAHEYHLNRHFIFDEIRGQIIQSIEINPRGNKIYFRLQDAKNADSSNTIYVLGIATGSLIQKFHEFNAKLETQGRIKISPCGTQIYSTNGPNIRHYKMINGNIVASENNKNILAVNCSLGDRGFISTIDYHPKDFFLACAIYGGNPGGVVIFNFESIRKELSENIKLGSQEMILQKSFESKQIGVYSDIIKRLDEVFLAPLANQHEASEVLKVQESNQPTGDNTFTIQTSSKRSKTYTVSQGPATFTIQKGGTYEIQKNDGTDEDETTISESLN
ncbi:jouberin-like isoform X2 [Chironomus tepperi]